MARTPRRPARHNRPASARPDPPAGRTPRDAESSRTAKRGKRPAPAAARGAGGEQHRPLLRAYLAMSLDGYIADARGGVEWLNAYFSPEIGFDSFARTIGAVVMGRTTYDLSIAHGHGPGAYGRAVVLTHRPLPDAPKGVEAYSGDVRPLTERLRQDLAGTGKDIWLMGGGRSIAPFHERGLVDRWEISMIPVLLGDGVPLFPKHARAAEPLRVTHTRVLKNGIVEVWYEPG